MLLLCRPFTTRAIPPRAASAASPGKAVGRHAERDQHQRPDSVGTLLCGRVVAGDGADVDSRPGRRRRQQRQRDDARCPAPHCSSCACETACRRSPRRLPATRPKPPTSPAKIRTAGSSGRRSWTGRVDGSSPSCRRACGSQPATASRASTGRDRRGCRAPRRARCSLNARRAARCADDWRPETCAAMLPVSGYSGPPQPLHHHSSSRGQSAVAARAVGGAGCNTRPGWRSGASPASAVQPADRPPRSRPAR